MVSDEQIAEIRGEALAARVLAGCALRMLINTRPDAKALVEALSAYVDRSLNISSAVGGDPALNERVREVARMRAQEDLSWIKAVADME